MNCDYQNEISYPYEIEEKSVHSDLKAPQIVVNHGKHNDIEKQYLLANVR